MRYREDFSIPSLHDILSKNVVTDSEGEAGPYTLENFEQFLFRSHCQENYEFWKCCNECLSQYDDAGFDVEKWNSIFYKRFIRGSSPMECNLPGDIREVFRNCYHDKSKIPKVMLGRARQHAWSLMTGAYRQYVRKVYKTNEGYSSSSRSASQSACTSPLISSRARCDTSSTSPATPAFDLPILSVGDTNTSTESSSNLASDSTAMYSASPLTKSRSFSSNLLRSFDRGKRDGAGSSDAIGAARSGFFSRGKELMSRFKSRAKHSSSISHQSKFSL